MKKQKKTKEELFLDKFEVWWAYWRENPHRFISEYLRIEPFSLFQKILIYLFFKFNYVMFWASRGLGKSYLTALYALTRCILYPGTTVVIASGTRNQAKTIISEKIQGFYNDSPNVRREIKDMNSKSNEPEVIFKNGSKIFVVAANDNARSHRANVLIVDEFRLVDYNIIKTVLAKFLTSTRFPKFRKKPEYKDMIEPNIEIYLSSAWFKSHWSYEKFEAYVDSMLNDNKYMTLGLPYQLGVESGIIDRQRVIDEKISGDFDPFAFDMEMNCLPYGESANAFFSYADILKCRNINRPLMPLTNLEYIGLEGSHTQRIKKSKFYVPKNPQEKRIMCVDVALMGGSQNDSTSIHVIRCIPNGNRYAKYLAYSETIDGQHTALQTLRIKQIFYDLECDTVVLDTNGNGLSIYDEAVRITVDNERGTEYPAWNAMNNASMSERSVFDKSAVKVIYSIKVAGANAAETNHHMATYTKSCIQNKTLHLMQTETDGMKFINEFAKKRKDIDENDIDRFRSQFILATMLITELVNLELVISQWIKLKEPHGTRKDKYSSLSYGLYYIKKLEADLSKGSKKIDVESWANVLKAEAKRNNNILSKSRKGLY